VLLATHLLGVAERLCTRLVIIDQGKLMRDVSGRELAELLAGGAGALEELYLSLVVTDEALS
jgi:ABC-type multidrug transport system ATPase subunit